MSGRRFEWDTSKAVRNANERRVSFDEAATVWSDDYRIEELDLIHTTEQEERYRMLGVSEKPRLLLVIFTERNETIRLISARRANQAETRRYAGQA